MNLELVFTLMVVFHTKHFIADFPLQSNQYMLGKFKAKGWMLPLAAHCAVHALFTFSIGCYFAHNWAIAGICAFIDFCIHFVMDRIKASPNLMGRWKNFTADGYAFINAGFFPPNLFQLEMPEPKSPHEPFITPVYLKSGDKEKLLRHNSFFWNALGFDQYIHGLTDSAVIIIMLWYIR